MAFMLAETRDARRSRRPKRSDKHAVVVEEGLLRDDVAQRQYFGVVIAGDVIGAAIGLICLAGVGSDVDGLVDEQVDALEIRLFREPRASFAEIVDRNLKGDVDAVAVYLFDTGLVGVFSRLLFPLTSSTSMNRVARVSPYCLARTARSMRAISRSTRDVTASVSIWSAEPGLCGKRLELLRQAIG